MWFPFIMMEDSLLSLTSQACSDRKDAQVIQSECSFYHYLCDGFDDRGWGCGYRSLQTLCSWAVKYNQRHPRPSPPSESPHRERCATVPSIPKIQSCLVDVGDKPPSFAGSKEWIGCYEASIVLDHLYEVPCKIAHVPRGSEVVKEFEMLEQHFKRIGSPVMIGGDLDGAAKTLIGVWSRQQPQKKEIQQDMRNQHGEILFLVADPHYSQGCSDDSRAVCKVSWHSIELFQDRSFYNFCLPQLP